jgi:hypothetical protein
MSVRHLTRRARLWAQARRSPLRRAYGEGATYALPSKSPFVQGVYLISKDVSARWVVQHLNA